ncbi:hypothetical protein JCM8547_008521 [Rhodosporidiobolus lusitaniae]
MVGHVGALVKAAERLGMGAKTSKTSPRSESPPLSAADLPFDVLLEIAKWVGYLDSEFIEEELVCWPVTATSPAMHSLCLVSKSWSEAAQVALYRSTSFTSIDQCRLFLRTADARPDLVKHVRAVQFGVLRPLPPHEEDELQARELTNLMIEAAGRCKLAKHLKIYPLVPPEGLNAYRLIEEFELDTLVLSLYDAYTVDVPTDLILEFYRRLYRHAIGHRSLKTLNYTFRPPTNPSASDVSPQEAIVSHLTSLHVSVNAEHVLFSVLPMMASTLLVLSIYVEKPLAKNLAISAFSQLVHLRELRLESNIAIVDQAAEQNLWLMDVIDRYPDLSKLSISEQDAHPRRFHSPPPKLRLFEFIDFSAHPDRSFGAFGELARNEEASFVSAEFVFVADEAAFEKTVERSEVEEVVEAFEVKGVTFRVKHEIEEILARRMVEL